MELLSALKNMWKNTVENKDTKLDLSSVAGNKFRN